MANIKNRKKLQLIQTIWDVMLYSRHFTFHWKLLGLVSRIEKSGTGDNNFGKWKGTFRSDRPKWPDRSQWTTFKAGALSIQPKIPVISVGTSNGTDHFGLVRPEYSGPALKVVHRDRSGHFGRSDWNVAFHLPKLLSPVPLFSILLTRPSSFQWKVKCCQSLAEYKLAKTPNLFTVQFQELLRIVRIFWETYRFDSQEFFTFTCIHRLSTRNRIPPPLVFHRLFATVECSLGYKQYLLFSFRA